MLAGTLFIEMPCVFMREENILVNTIDEIWQRIVPVLKRLALILSVIVFSVLVWQGWSAAWDSYEFHDVTADLGLPKFWHWTIVLVGMSLAALAAFYIALLGNDVGRAGDRA